MYKVYDGPWLATFNIHQAVYLRKLFGIKKRDESAEKSLAPQVVTPLVVCYSELQFFPCLHRSPLQYHLSVPVKAGQELPCRMQAAHPQCGTSLGISAHTHMLTLPFPTASTDAARGRNLNRVFTVTSALGSVKTHTDRCCGFPN